jgi:hypothetical protein
VDTIGPCRKCGETAVLIPSRKWCRPCNAANTRAFRKKNPGWVKAYDRKRYARDRVDEGFVAAERKRGREYWRKLRHEAIMAYGGYHCACCGETEPLFLELDHVLNDGAAHRRSLGYAGNGKGASSRTLSWLKEHNYPAGFQVLCANCNKGKERNGGVCTHHGNAGIAAQQTRT